MKQKTVWQDTIDGFTVEFVNWSFNGEAPFDKWNYYVYFTAKNTPPELWEKLIAIDPGKYAIDYYNSFLSNLDWHCGITFAEFERNSMQEIVAIKAGCDYSHSWDEWYTYELADLERDCRATIASAKALFNSEASA